MHHWGYFHPFGFIFFLLLIGLLISNIVMWRRRSGMCQRHSHHALTILEKRLASGEIGIEEYEKIKGHLHK